MEPKRPRVAKAALSRKNQAGNFTFPDFKIYYNTTLVNTVWIWNKDRYRDPWSKIQSWKIKPRIYNQLIFNKSVTHVQWGKDSLFINCVGETEYPHTDQSNWTLTAYHMQKSMQNGPGWYSSVLWAWDCEPKHCWFDSQSGYMPGCRTGSQ